MRAMLIVLLSSVLLLGCKHTRPSDTPASSADASAKKKRAEKAASKPAAGREATAVPQATPVNESAGKVASVNPDLRFVVIDFSLHPVPIVDQRLSVFRQGQKVGEVKISGQARNSIVAADITAGEAQKGDEVRPE